MTMAWPGINVHGVKISSSAEQFCPLAILHIVVDPTAVELLDGTKWAKWQVHVQQNWCDPIL